MELKIHENKKKATTARTCQPGCELGINPPAMKIIMRWNGVKKVKKKFL